MQNGIFRNNKVYANGDNGISIGHHDTDNIFYNNHIYENGFQGVLFRNETEQNSGHRNTFTNNIIENNGMKEESSGFLIGGETRDIVLTNNTIRSLGRGNQSTAILLPRDLQILLQQIIKYQDPRRLFAKNREKRRHFRY
ncbi:MAG: right-handed parallel beta-helix repeat-containing protein [Saprospiraceae bacterium]|nr:right-handed parallel beta-helix repeat-containing protein [Saprospiraceae bacterium]